MLLGAPYAPAGLVQDPSAPASVSPNTAGVPQDLHVPAVVAPNTVVSSDHSVPVVPTGVSQGPSAPGGLVQDPSAPAVVSNNTSAPDGVSQDPPAPAGVSQDPSAAAGVSHNPSTPIATGDSQHTSTSASPHPSMNQARVPAGQQPPPVLTLEAQMDHYASSRYSCVGKMDEKSLDERVYFNSEISNGQRTRTVQVRGVLEGKPTQYFCLAGCLNGRGKNRGTNTFQISAGQGWQSVFEHCCSEGHFISICTNNSNPAADKNKQDIAGVKDRYRDEVEPFAKRCAKQRKQARAQQGSSAPSKKRRAQATGPTPTPQQNIDQQQLHRIQAKFASFAAKQGVSPETVDAMVDQGVKLQQGRSR